MDSHDRRHLSDEMEIAELRDRLEKAERLADAVSHLYDYEWSAGTAERLDPIVKAWRAFREPADLNKAKRAPEAGGWQGRFEDDGGPPPPIAPLPEDCCSGFVTQEGRDIHQAIAHEPSHD